MWHFSGRIYKTVWVGGWAESGKKDERGRETPVLTGMCLHGTAADSVDKRELLRHNFIKRIKLWYVLNKKILSNILINIMDLTNCLCNNNLLEMHSEIKIILRGK